MLKALSLTAVAALAILGAASAVAQNGQGQDAQAPDGPPPGMHGPPAFSDIDSNKDGVISQDEFAAFHAKMKEHHDHGHDGDDGHHGHHHWGKGHPPMDMKMLDENGDGKVSFDEFVAPMKKHFDRMDANHDGVLEADELVRPHDGDGPPPPAGN